MSQPTPVKPPAAKSSLLMRVRRSIWREPLSNDERSHVRQVLNDLILHLHPTKVPLRTLKLTYNFGLGGLSLLSFLVLVMTGVLLMFVYTPTPADAYLSIQRLQSTIWMGQFVRNLHHWSANLLLILVVLHMLRVYYTAAFHAPREFNWILGWGMLVLVALSNFTGYLLPWDQLAYWATTIVTSMLGYIPVIGESLKTWLLGGAEIGPATLRTFFAFHVVVFPLLMGVLASYHFWRVRKDTFSIPRGVDDPPVNPKKLVRVTTIPHLVDLELVVGLVTLALLTAWATGVNAPLGEAANPAQPPNPAKAAWYFLGFQELLLHFHPVVVTVVIPGLVVMALLLLPYADFDESREPDAVGIWFRSRRGRRLALVNAIGGIAMTAALVVIDDYGRQLALLPPLPPLVSGLLPLGIILVALAGYWLFLRARGLTSSERNLALFTLLFMAFVTLTVIGNFFRGQNMALTFPWGG